MTDAEHRLVARLIKTVRVDARLKQTDLSERLGWAQSVISKSESGERRLDLVEIWSICGACGVSLSDFVARFENEIREAHRAR